MGQEQQQVLYSLLGQEDQQVLYLLLGWDVQQVLNLLVIESTFVNMDDYDTAQQEKELNLE